ncbi:MAG: hypothetical protein FWF43_01705 [Propionibacteriaceae bacterium]|nr:hypothetical protein [Propionibacteriaceae bacterium]
MSPAPNDPAPRRSFPGHQTSSSGPPRRAFTPEETQPILSGYTYQPREPGQTSQPPPLSQTASEPLAPLTPPADSMENYKPKKRLGWVIALVIILVVGISAGIFISMHQPPAAPSQSATARPTSYPTPSRTGGQAFADPTVTGYWKITSTQWSSTGVRLNVEITVDTGLLRYSFYAYANSDSTRLDPVTTSASDLLPGFAGPGDTVTGTLTFELTRQPMTLVLVSTSQPQLSALAVEG